jgi:hypothetical protein
MCNDVSIKRYICLQDLQSLLMVMSFIDFPRYPPRARKYYLSGLMFKPRLKLVFQHPCSSPGEMFQRLPGSESVSLVVSNLFLECFLNSLTLAMQISKLAALFTNGN